MSSLLERISRSHDFPSDNALQEGLLRDVYDFLYKLDDSRHLFCDAEVHPIAIHALILFSFMQNDVLDWYKPRIIRSLTTCAACVVQFHMGRANLRRAFAVRRKIPYGSVQEFNDIILSWEAERVINSLENVWMNIQAPDTPLNNNAQLTLTECFLAPGMFRVNSILKTLFARCFFSYSRSGKYVPPSSITPSLLFFFFDGTNDEKSWALQFLKSVRTIGDDWNCLMDEEFFIHFINIQNPHFYSDQKCIRFWMNVRPFLNRMTESTFANFLEIEGLDVIQKYFNFKIVPLNFVLSNQLFAFLNLPLPILLSALYVFFVKLGSKFWTIMKPFTFVNFLDPVFGNPYYLTLLKELAAPQIKSGIYEPKDLFIWLFALYDSLTSAPQKQQAGLRIATFLLDQTPSGPTVDTSLKLLIECSKLSNIATVSQPAWELLSKVDTRNFISIKSTLLTEIASGGHDFKPDLAVTNLSQISNPLRSKAITVLSHAVLYDIHYFSEKGNNLKENRDANLGNMEFNLNFWHALAYKVRPSDVPFAIEILKSLTHVSRIAPINEKIFILKHKIRVSDKNAIPILNKIRSFNKEVAGVFEGVCKFLEKLNSFEGPALKAILTDSAAALGYWSCTLSSNKHIYQSAINLLYEAFDVEGRLEGVTAILNHSPQTVLNSIHTSLTWLMYLDLYDPCPSAVRLLMDIVTALSNPLNGVLHKMSASNVPDSVASDLRLFWKRSWFFLDFIYRKTLDWAKAFSASELIDFTRDTLDLSHMLIDCYTTVESIVRTHDLFEDIMRSLQDMLVWLRLGDPSLLSSCVSLILKTLDISEEQKLPMNSKIIELLAQYVCKAKKFNNRLTEEQRMEILMRAKAFDGPLVDRVMEASGTYRDSASATPVDVEVVDLDDNDDSHGSEQENIDQRQKGGKQADLSRFVSRSNSPMIAPAPKVPPQKTSMLAAAKASLAQARSSGNKSTSAPAPPRPAGFNRRANQTSDSESSDSDSDDDDSLFHVKRDRTLANKLKNTNVSAPTKKIVLLNKAQQKKQIDQKAIDAYNMRMRLNVDLNPLYAHVLSWNYSRVDNFPVELKEDQDVYKRIIDSFKTPDDYIRTFEPLLLLECWQAIQQSKQIAQEQPFQVIVGGRATTDKFFEVYASIKKSVVQDRKLGDTDMIVLTFCPETSSYMGENVPSADNIKISPITCLAKIKEIKSVNAEFCDITLKVISRNNPLASFMTPRTELFGMKVMQMITIEREYSSLRGLPYYDLAKQIVQAVPNIPEQMEALKKEKMRKLYDVNPSQAQAIAGSVHSDGFSLIQGPPGTGKTKTILGIVGYILTSLRESSAQPISVPGVKPPVSKHATQSRKVLICAPSNAAVDELVLRLRSGIRNADGEIFHPRLVRLGRSDAINPAVRDLTLEELVDKELESKEGLDPVTADPKIREEHNKCLLERNRIKIELQRSDLNSEQMDALNLQLRKCVERKNELGKQLDEQRERISKSTRTRDIERRAIQARLLTQAQVICSTLSGSAHDVLASLSLNFDSVIIDEAAQCIELSAIIPLRYGCKRCIMVGDPNQLPPTVLSQAAASYSYEQSLFVRMQRQHPESVYLLNVQYRMHPEISNFPSAQFYESRLIDGPKMEELNTRPWHKQDAFKPYIFYDVIGAQQSQNQRTRSYFNSSEANAALTLVGKLFDTYTEENWAGRIGIISPYKEQIRVLRDIFIRKFGSPILRIIDFNTVDGFQGQEKEIIIISCVRANESSGVGFLSDVRRMNVALTRSKTSLWILGSKSSLIQNKVWRNLIEDASKRNLLISTTSDLSQNMELPKVLKSSNSGSLSAAPSTRIESKPQIPADVPAAFSDHSDTKKPADKEKKSKRIVVPFQKQRRNVLSAESVKRISEPTASGKLPKNDFKEKASSVSSVPEAPLGDPRLKRKLEKNAKSGESGFKSPKFSKIDSSSLGKKAVAMSSGTVPSRSKPLPPPPPPPLPAMITTETESSSSVDTLNRSASTRRNSSEDAPRTTSHSPVKGSATLSLPKRPSASPDADIVAAPSVSETSYEITPSTVITSAAAPSPLPPPPPPRSPPVESAVEAPQSTPPIRGNSAESAVSKTPELNSPVSDAQVILKETSREETSDESTNFAKKLSRYTKTPSTKSTGELDQAANHDIILNAKSPSDGQFSRKNSKEQAVGSLSKVDDVPPTRPRESKFHDGYTKPHRNPSWSSEAPLKRHFKERAYGEVATLPSKKQRKFKEDGDLIWDGPSELDHRSDDFQFLKSSRTGLLPVSASAPNSRSSEPMRLSKPDRYDSRFSDPYQHQQQQPAALPLPKTPRALKKFNKYDSHQRYNEDTDNGSSDVSRVYRNKSWVNPNMGPNHDTANAPLSDQHNYKGSGVSKSVYYNPNSPYYHKGSQSEYKGKRFKPRDDVGESYRAPPRKGNLPPR